MKNRTQADLARLAGVSERAVRKAEAGDGVTLETFGALVQALGYADEVLFVLEQPKPTTLEEHQRIAMGHHRPRKRAR